MLTEFADLLNECGLECKATKSNWFANRAAWDELRDPQFRMRVPVSSICSGRLGTSSSGAGQVRAATFLEFQLCSELIVVGSCLTVDADTDAAIDFALARARGLWMQSKTALCRKRVPISKRVENYYCSIGASALHGLEGVPLTQTALKKVMGFDRSCLRAMARMVKHEGETWVNFRRRQNKFLRNLFDKLQIQELGVRLLSKQHGWARHVLRLSPSDIAYIWANTGTLEEWHSMQAFHSVLDPTSKNRWRHSTRAPKFIGK